MLIQTKSLLFRGNKKWLFLKLFLVPITSIFALNSAPMALADDADCWNKTGDSQIKACTRIIKSRRLNGKKVSKIDLAKIYNLRGTSYTKIGKLGYAISDFGNAIKHNKDFADAYYNRAIAFDRKGLLETAKANYEKAIQLNPKEARYYINLGVMKNRLFELDHAIKLFDSAIRLDPKIDKAYSNRGSSYLQKGKFDQALSDFNHAFALNSKNYKAYDNRGIVYARKGEYGRAISNFDNAIALNPNDSMAHHNRGYVHQLKGQKDKAIADYRKAVRIEPNNRLAKTKLNRLLGVQECSLTGHFAKDYPNLFYQTKWPSGYLKNLLDALDEIDSDDTAKERKGFRLLQKLAILYDVHFALKRDIKITTSILVLMLVTAGCDNEANKAFTRISFPKKRNAYHWSEYGLAAHLLKNWKVSQKALSKAKNLDDKFFDSRPLLNQIFEASKLGKTAFPNQPKS